MFSRLLVGLDGSAGAEAALVAAIALGRRFRSTVLLASIADPASIALDRIARLTDDAATRVTDAGLAIEVRHASGAVDDELLYLAEQADAVVIGRRGSHGAHGGVGVQTSRIINRSPKPVVVAGESPSLFQRPAVAWDGGTTSTNALALAARYAEAAQVPLDVVHVSDDAGAGELLAQAAASLSAERITVTTHLLRGRLTQALPAHLVSDGIDLLVVGAHGGRRRRSWSVGSHAEQLIRATSLPVIVIR